MSLHPLIPAAELKEPEACLKFAASFLAINPGVMPNSAWKNTEYLISFFFLCEQTLDNSFQQTTGRAK